MRVLFVCTGNICRSPMAEGLLREAIHRDPVLRERRFAVRSAGTSGLEGWPASEPAIAAMERRGIDLTGHRARLLDQELVEWADAILVMEAFHREWVLRRFPEAARKTELLAVYAGGGGDVEDPYGADEDTYLACADTLADLIARILPRLRSSGSAEDDQ